MATRPRPLSPHLQVYRWQYTMVLSVLHRATGVVLAIALLLLAYWLLALASGPEAYAGATQLLASPLGLLVVAGFTLAFWYHFCTGIRHLIWDTGRGLEKVAARRSAAIVVAAALALTVASLAAMLHFGAAA